MATAPLAEIRSRIGDEVGVSNWLTIDQKRIDEFAEATEDRQFIHTDPEKAADTPFGQTIAHGVGLQQRSRSAGRPDRYRTSWIGAWTRRQRSLRKLPRCNVRLGRGRSRSRRCSVDDARRS